MSPLKSALAELSGIQRQALEWGQGPLLVLRGPGSDRKAVLEDAKSSINFLRLVVASYSDVRVYHGLIGLNFCGRPIGDFAAVVASVSPNKSVLPK